mgnify:FL=1|tara:strand:- start:12613 stop:13023 length:411 start_codon:yes stop_codon:yes gene_type:complete
MRVLSILAKFFTGLWKFLRSTLLSKKWWDKYYWMPVAFLVGLITWILSGGTKSPSKKIIDKINGIKKSEREKIAKITKESKKRNSKDESEAEEQKERIQKETARKLEDARDKIEKENKKLESDSDTVNDMLNDLLD